MNSVYTSRDSMSNYTLPRPPSSSLPPSSSPSPLPPPPPPPSSSSSLYHYCSNSFAEIQSALNLLEKKCDQLQQDIAASTLMPVCYISANLNCFDIFNYNSNRIGYLIGRKGHRIKNIEQKYGVSIKIPKEDQNVRPIRIHYDRFTSAGQINEAIFVICTTLQEI